MAHTNFIQARKIDWLPNISVYTCIFEKKKFIEETPEKPQYFNVHFHLSTWQYYAVQDLLYL